MLIFFFFFFVCLNSHYLPFSVTLINNSFLCCNIPRKKREKGKRKKIPQIPNAYFLYTTKKVEKIGFCFRVSAWTKPSRSRWLCRNPVGQHSFKYVDNTPSFHSKQPVYKDKLYWTLVTRDIWYFSLFETHSTKISGILYFVRA